jgi:hypothetical protein
MRTRDRRELAICWLGAAALFGAALAVFGSRPSIAQGAPGGALTWLGLGAAAITAGAAALTALRLSLPERAGNWALLPLPALTAWAGASGLGCFAARGTPEAWGETPAEAAECLAFLLGVSLPLSALMLVMLRRARPLRPRLALALGGVASAAAAAVLLSLAHPHPSTALDLAVHALALGGVVALNVSARRLLPGANTR